MEPELRPRADRPSAEVRAVTLDLARARARASEPRLDILETGSVPAHMSVADADWAPGDVSGERSASRDVFDAGQHCSVLCTVLSVGALHYTLDRTAVRFMRLAN
jgi:hypothetical protein